MTVPSGSFTTIRLYHYRARMYDPQLSRFLGRDPIGFRGSQFNLYELVSGDPLKYVDTFGLQQGGNSSWWNHYFYGNGAHWNLDGRVYSAWYNSSITQSVVAEAIGKITKIDPGHLGCNQTSYHFISFSSAVDYAPGNVSVWDPLYPIGNTTLTVFVMCKFSVTYDDKTVSDDRGSCNASGHLFIRTKCTNKNCNGFVMLFDKFIDVMDPGDLISGNQDLVGVPYTFSARRPIDYSDRNCEATIEWEP